MRPAALVSLVAILAAAPLRAQDPAAACINAIPDSTLKRVPVFASIELASPGQNMPASGASLIQAIGHHARREIGAALGELPDADPRFTWRDLDGRLSIWSHRDGRVTWTVDTSSQAWARSHAGIELLARALGTARDSGAGYAVWPNGAKADSVEAIVNFVRPRIDPAGVMHPAEATMAVPIFSVLAPRETEVSMVRQSRKRFPDSLLRHGVTGTVLLEFVVDTNGLADTATVRDANPEFRETLSRQKRDYYDQFISTACRMIADARYAPQTINGCRVRQRVRQPFSWMIGR